MKKPGFYLATICSLSMLAACSGGDSSTRSLNAMSVDQQIMPRQKTVAVITALNYDRVAQSLYVAYFGRPADPAGLANVESSLLQAGAPTDAADLSAAYSTNPAVRNLINNFATSKESITLYGNAEPEAFVNAVYENLFGRAPALSGLVFWTGAIQDGGLNKAGAALAILAASESNTSAQGLIDGQTVNNKLAWASYFTSQLSAQNASSLYAGTAIGTSIRSYLDGVQASTSSASIEEQVSVAISNLLASNQSAAADVFNAVTWSGTQFVAVGAGGKVATSPDGTTWSSRGSAIGNPMTGANLSSVTSQYGRLIAVGSNGGGVICSGTQVCPYYVTAPEDVIVYSSDGINWTTATSISNGTSFPTAGELNNVIWTGGQFVAVGDNSVLTSTSTGEIAINTGSVYTSLDGLNWSAQTAVMPSTGSGSSSFNKLDAVAWSGKTYVALGTQGGIYTSPNGSTWTAQTPPSTNYTMKGVVWSGTNFVAVGLGGIILQSPDGVTWTTTTMVYESKSYGPDLNAVTWSGSQFVAVGSGTILTSPDGIIWISHAIQGVGALNSVVWSGSLFVAVGYNAILSSTDGITWTSRALP